MPNLSVPIFSVAYDLHSPWKNYDDLIRKLTTFRHLHVQKSLWFVEYRGGASELCLELDPFLDDDDDLFVDRVTARWSRINNRETDAWLRARGL